jgi:hypothetical protein
MLQNVSAKSYNIKDAITKHELMVIHLLASEGFRNRLITGRITRTDKEKRAISRPKLSGAIGSVERYS